MSVVGALKDVIAGLDMNGDGDTRPNLAEELNQERLLEISRLRLYTAEAIEGKVHRKRSQPPGTNFIPNSRYSAGSPGYKLGWSMKSRLQ